MKSPAAYGPPLTPEVPMATIKTAVALATLLLFGGCAANMAALPPVEMPVCTAGKDCELKWAMARRWVLNNAGFKIQHITDDYIETFNGRDSSSPMPWARIVKEPIDAERYRISLEVGCNNLFGCVPPAAALVNQFRSTMASGALSAPAHSAPTISSPASDGPRNPNAR